MKRTWREDISLVEGKEYKVQKNFKTTTDAFTKGEILIFTGSDYSRYDSSTALRFTSKTSGEGKSFFLQDDQPFLTEDLFEACN